jgi:hypothetical protein
VGRVSPFLLLESADKFPETDSNRAADGTEFQQVHTSFPGFVPAYERLRLAEFCRQIFLAHAGLGPDFPEQIEQPLAVSLCNSRHD